MANTRITRTRIRNYVNYFVKKQGFTRAKAIRYVAKEYGLSEDLVRLALKQ